MPPKPIYISTLLIATCISSCGIFSNKNLAMRYRNKWNLATFKIASTPLTFVQVDLHSVLITEPPAKDVKFNMLSLTDKGQEAFIQAANSKSATAAQLLEQLTTNFEFSKDEKPKIKIVPKTIKKTLIFTVDRLQAHYTPGVPPTTTFNLLGDRISYLEMTINLPVGTNAIFNAWDKYVTDKINLNLGKVTSAQNWNASLSVSAKGAASTSLTGSNTHEVTGSESNNNFLTFINSDGLNSANNTNGSTASSGTTGTTNNGNSFNGSAELGGNATIGFSDKFETSLDLSSQILKLSGTLAENKVILRQEGGPGIDLSGNIVVSMEYALTDDWALPVLFTKIKAFRNPVGGTLYAATALQTSHLTVVFPDIQNNITGELNYSFIYRQVVRGNRHLPEARQKAKYRFGTVDYLHNSVTNYLPVNLVRPQDVRPKAYYIRQGTALQNLALNGQDLRFETITEATNFLSYIQELIQNGVPLIGLTFGGVVITPVTFPILHVVTIQL